jgi:hypothetical protein
MFCSCLPRSRPRLRLEAYKERPDVELLSLYSGDAGGTVLISSDTRAVMIEGPSREALELVEVKEHVWPGVVAVFLVGVLLLGLLFYTFLDAMSA